MYTILDFIDSPEIRKCNEATVFTPAQQAVLIMRSRQRSMEEKLAALQNLVDTFTEEEFGGAGVFRENNEAVPDGIMREITIRNIEYYRRLLEKRYVSKECVFAAALYEQNESNDHKHDVNRYCFQADFESAFQKLKEEKAEYENDIDLQDVMLWGEIIRIPLKEEDEVYDSGWIRYRYSHDLRLVEVEGEFFQNKDGIAAYKLDEILLDLDDDLNEAFGVHISTPFRPGDLVKSIDYRNSPTYGVIHGCQGKMNEEWWEWQDGVMGVRFDIYLEGKFGWDHNFPILSLSYCGEKEIPYDNRMLKLLSKLQKGELDDFSMLFCVSRGEKELDDLLRCYENRKT